MSDTTDKLRPYLRQAIENIQKPVRLRALNSMIGFEKAFALFDIDREMASFRAITAQEEAAAALFLALKARKYPGSDRLSVRLHDHKAALWPVLDAARIALSPAFRELNLSLTVDPPAVRISMKLSNFVQNLGEDMRHARLTLAEPLGLLRSKAGSPADFTDEIAAIVEAHGAKSIRQHIRDLANSRNSLLYASEKSLPISRATVEGLEQRRTQAEMALCLGIAVLQTKALQAYALQTLELFLIVLDRAEGVEMPHHKPPPLSPR